MVVIEELSSRKLVAVGSLIVEKKLWVVVFSTPPQPLWQVSSCVCIGGLIWGGFSLRNLGVVGHIEDISVAKEMQGKQFGLRIIQALDYIAEKVGCYKAILDCSEKNEGFYVKCGYARVGVQMVSLPPLYRAPLG